MYVTDAATDRDSHTKTEASNKEGSDVIYMQDMLEPYAERKRKKRNV